MSILKKTFSKHFLIISGLLFSLMLTQGCKAYKSPTNLAQAANTEEKGVVKVTMVNGDEYIYENIEFSGDTYYGVKTENGEKVKTTLLKEEVLKVERKNKGGLGVLGTIIVLGSVVMAILMF